MKITQMVSPTTGKPVPNQYTIRVGRYEFFQSYNTVIARRDVYSGEVVLADMWNYSRTTSKYRNEFLRETTAQTKSKIARGEYTVVPFLDMEDPDCISLVWSVEDVFVRDAAYRGAEMTDYGTREGGMDYSGEDTNDVRQLPRITLDEARGILADIKRDHDCQYGVTWDSIDQGIDDHYDRLKGV